MRKRLRQGAGAIVSSAFLRALRNARIRVGSQQCKHFGAVGGLEGKRACTGCELPLALRPACAKFVENARAFVANGSLLRRCVPAR